MVWQSLLTYPYHRSEDYQDTRYYGDSSIDHRRKLVQGHQGQTFLDKYFQETKKMVCNYVLL